MASLNDNLFTRLVGCSRGHHFTGTLKTQWGLMQASLSERGIDRLTFNATYSAQPTDDPVFKEAFMKWLTSFQKRSAAAQWSYFAATGTDFQKSVWQALLEVPFGTQLHYQDIAKKIRKPKAARAVGSAIAANPIAVLIPCHRIVPPSGATGNYRWGRDRKRVLLDAERAHGSDLCKLFQ